MLRFIRLFGGALGVILAIALVGFDGRQSTALLEPSLAGRLLLLAWIAAWGVVGYVIAPYLTIVPARWLVRAVTDMSTDEFVAAVAGLLVGLLMGFLLGLPLTSLPSPAGLVLPDRRLHHPGAGHDGPHRRQAARPARRDRGPRSAAIGSGGSGIRLGLPSRSPSWTPAPSSTAASWTSWRPAS